MPIGEEQERESLKEVVVEEHSADEQVDLAQTGVKPDPQPNVEVKDELSELSTGPREGLVPEEVPQSLDGINFSGSGLVSTDALKKTPAFDDVLAFATGGRAVGGNPVLQLLAQEYGTSEMLAAGDPIVIKGLVATARSRSSARIDNLFEPSRELSAMEERELGGRDLAKRQVEDVAHRAQSHIGPRVATLGIGDYAVPSMGKTADPELLRNLAGRVLDGAHERFYQTIPVQNLRFVGGNVRGTLTAQQTDARKAESKDSFSIAA